MQHLNHSVISAVDERGTVSAFIYISLKLDLSTQDFGFMNLTSVVLRRPPSLELALLSLMQLLMHEFFGLSCLNALFKRIASAANAITASRIH